MSSSPPDGDVPPPPYGDVPPPPDGDVPPPPDVTSPPPPPDVTSPGTAGPSPPVLSALIVVVVLCVLAGLGISVCVYRRKKRKEAQTLVVAIKQLKSGSGQGEREFQAEIEIISRIHHRHLVSLFGYCITGAQRMLVYEFVPNNTLEFHLHENGRPTMNWSKTMRIAVGAAKGLAYLHEDCQPKIIHRDIKASNILIDNSFEAKVADFGLAKYSLDTETHVSTRVMGTFGYDELALYAFVLISFSFSGILELNYEDLKARPLLKQALEDGNLDAVVDPKLQDYDFNEMTQMIRCAAACVRRSGQFRPRMSQIVRALEGNMPIDELNEGVTSGSSDYNTGQYMDDLKKFRKLALESPEHDNSTVNPLASASSQECSEPTSESGRNTFSSCSEGQQTIPEMNSTN
ncbi:PROLINE-RICH RECEPTOR-LIKE PROTEIN KINASE PERK4 [Salix viminalis]|uniref:non-specific serine/threonine protein kinase n=1 Tax=Salix viminalis TaxID=40686 RepID=A0A9Q0TP44_SALVM|nr:PROLINE-RICH RECEPTOR-LIKE PROTEIN KINASE PERK4 [Salix viminalis]